MGEQKDIVSVAVPDQVVVTIPDESVVAFTHDEPTVVVVQDQDAIAIEEQSIYVVTMGQAGPAGYGDSNYNRATAMVITVGGATPGTTFAGTVQDALDKILYPYQNPSFTAFSFPQGNLEVGAVMSGGSKTFTWSTSNSGSVQANTIKIEDITTSTVLLTGGANDGTEDLTISGITNVTNTSHTWRITATNTQSGLFTRDFTLFWQWKRYYGESTLPSLTENDIEALRVGGLVSQAGGTYSFLGGGYKYYAYPTALGLRTQFKDVNTNFAVSMEPPTTVSVTNVYGVTTNYYVHRTTNILGGAITIAIS